MAVNFSGVVQFANGSPAQAVRVRIFDADAAGKGDDDLTIAEGLSDAEGRFSLSYAPLRYLDDLSIHLPAGSSAPSGLHLPDLGDAYLPYLRFDYTFNGQAHSHTSHLGMFQSHYRLPQYPAVDFLPSTHGFRFINTFPGYFLPFSAPAFLTSRKVSASYGLCGGMCAAACDYALAGASIPPTEHVPHTGTRLQRYLFERQIDSFGGLGQHILKVAHWTSLPDDTPLGVQRRTADELVSIRPRLEDRNLVVLALIYERARSLDELGRLIFNNHQVLAYACQSREGGRLSIRVYDPNLPGRDDVVLNCQPVNLGGAGSNGLPDPIQGMMTTQLLGGTFYRAVRGFFALPYTFIQPRD